MIVSVVQYLPRDAQPQGVATEVSDTFADAYQEMRRRGYWLAVETQLDGALTVTVESRHREADCEVVPTPSGLRVALESMLQRRVWRKRAPKVNHHATIQ